MLAGASDAWRLVRRARGWIFFSAPSLVSVARGDENTQQHLASRGMSAGPPKLKLKAAAAATAAASTISPPPKKPRSAVDLYVLEAFKALRESSTLEEPIDLGQVSMLVAPAVEPRRASSERHAARQPRHAPAAPRLGEKKGMLAVGN